MTVWRENPRARIMPLGGAWWHEDPQHPDWLYLGFAPRPRSHFQWAAHHVHHGRMMRYSWVAIARFLIRGRTGRAG